MRKVWIGVFLALEVVAYALIMTCGGELLVWSSFLSIVGCFCFALLGRGDPYLVAGLGCTVIADLFLVVSSPVQRLWGMVAFLCAQSLYALRLHKAVPRRWLGWCRGGLVVVSQVVTVAVLGGKTDPLALVSLAYYAMLICNLIHAFAGKRWRFAVALVLFLLCDTVIGLQVAAGGYLPIGEGSVLYQILYPGFNLAWMFYLPSQVLISLEAER